MFDNSKHGCFKLPRKNKPTPRRKGAGFISRHCRSARTRQHFAAAVVARLRNVMSELLKMVFQQCPHPPVPIALAAASLHSHATCRRPTSEGHLRALAACPAGRGNHQRGPSEHAMLTSVTNRRLKNTHEAQSELED